MLDVVNLVRLAGAAHIVSLGAILYAARHMRWNEELSRVPRLLKQMCDAYHAFTSATIIAMGVVSLALPAELANGSPLARAICGYIAVFWIARLVLQFTYDVSSQLTSLVLRIAYHGLTALFVAFIALYGWLSVGIF